MEHRKLGSLDVSLVGLGCNNFGMRINTQQARSVVDAAIDAAVDTLAARPLATLTGAVMVGLGPYTAGVMSNDLSLVERWLAAARLAGEDMWHLPLPDKLRDQLKSDIADMRNTGDRWGGALTAGLFLKEFAGDRPWAHLDIAGPAFLEKDTPTGPKGATGAPVRTMLRYLMEQG